MNTTTPKPITGGGTRDHIEDRSPIGTRYADGKYTYTLVAYSVDPYSQHAMPLFIADGDPDVPVSNWYERAAYGSIHLYELPDIANDGETLEVAEPYEEKTAAAFTALTNRVEPTFRDTTDFTRVTLYADLANDNEVAAFLAYAKAELKLREAQYLVERAAQDRADMIALLVDLKGSQPKAAKTLGLNQSTISRALRERRPEQP
ncbi:hypothetical protein ABT282_06985 [Streptomyces sp. NPDC000927]|uniref:hypothetical protein n=1 Tax=Streptomyces sp. NPDC000927 TaxID=3154371 RepID=UPI00332BE2EF